MSNDLIRDTPTHDDTPPTMLERRVDRLTTATETLVSLIDELVHPEPPRRDVVYVPMDGRTEVLIGGSHAAAAFRSVTLMGRFGSIFAATSQGAAIDAARRWMDPDLTAWQTPPGVIGGGLNQQDHWWVTEPIAGTSLAIAAVVDPQNIPDPMQWVSVVVYRHTHVLAPDAGYNP